MAAEVVVVVVVVAMMEIRRVTARLLTVKDWEDLVAVVEMTLMKILLNALEIPLLTILLIMMDGLLLKRSPTR